MAGRVTVDKPMPARCVSHTCTDRRFDDPPLTLVATLVAKAGSEDELQQTLQDLQGASRAEADCIQYDFHKDAEQPRTFHMVEQWRDEAALTAHEATPHFQAALPVIERAAEKFSVMKMYRVS